MGTPLAPRNVYRDDEYIGVMFSPIDASLVVAALNGAPQRGESEILMDGGGGIWERMGPDAYSLRDDAGTGIPRSPDRTREYIARAYGLTGA